jgi:hypothetical protein
LVNWSSLGSGEVLSPDPVRRARIHRSKQRAVSVLGREVHAVGDALKPIEAVALDNDLGAIQECMIAGIRVDGGRPAANRVAAHVLAASTGTNSRAYWNFESSSLQQTVRLSPGFASVRGKARVFSHYADHAGRQLSAETRKAQQRRAEQRWCLCRAIFQYRSATDAVRDSGRAGPQVKGGLHLKSPPAALSSDRLKRSRARSAAGPRPAADASAPAACLRSTHAAGGRRGWLA